jgi:hypothetical protein
MNRLGERPQVIGTYEAPFPHGASDPPTDSAFAADIHRFLDCAHPGIDKLDRYTNPWGNYYHPPAVTSWASTTSHVSTTDNNPALLTGLLETANSSNNDLNAVFIGAIPHYAEGITGIGLSAEVRAFWTCYLISLYSTSPEVARYQTSSRNIHLIDAVTLLSDRHISYIYAQLLPTITQVLHPRDPTIDRWCCYPALPLLYFCIHLTERGKHPFSSKEIKTVINQLHVASGHFPILSAQCGYNKGSRVSLATVIAWILEYQFLVSPRTKTRFPTVLNSGALTVLNSLPPRNRTYRRPIEWMNVTTVADVNACVDSLQNFGLNEVWQSMNLKFQEAVASAILKDAPSQYKNQAEVVCRELLEAYMYADFIKILSIPVLICCLASRDDQISDELRTKISHKWIEFVALGENYVESFRTIVLLLDKTHAKTMFASMIKLLNPTP